MSSVRRRPNRSEYVPPVENEAETQKPAPSDNLLSLSDWAIIYVTLLGFLFLSFHLHTCLPTPKDPSEDNSVFSEIRARKILKELSEYGPKPSGSYACETQTRNRILSELQIIKKTGTSDVKFEIETQNPTGCFDIPKFDTDGFTVCYKNVSNVIARLGKKDSQDSLAVLLNCHYDSWPTGSGGSDDLISCALMLELIRVLSSNPHILKHDVIFLFNGAEESSLLAAHGFITKHSWRHSIRAFINLEASGSGGRELLFQAGPSNQWLLNSYLEAAVHPHCSVIGQEVFQSGVYPGDTDFRIFRDYGRVPGLDLAFVQNGYWWHTEFDEEKRITSGSLQRGGENVLSTLVHLLNSPYLEKPAEYGDKKSVFFDFLGLFVVVYPLSLAHIVNMLIYLVTVAVFINGFFRGANYKLAFRNYFLVCLAMYLMLYGMTKLTYKWIGVLSWYTHHWVAFVLYGFPVVWIGSTTQTFLTNSLTEKQKQAHAHVIETVHLLVVSIILVAFTYYDIASGFLFTLMALPLLKKLINVDRLNKTWTVIVHLLFYLPSLLMTIYSTTLLLSVFVPIMGRTSSNPEPIVASFVALSAFVIVLSTLPLLTKSNSVRDKDETKFRHYLSMLVGILMVLVVLLYVLKTAIGGPFRFTDNYPTTKRTQFYHTNRLFLNQDDSLKLNDSIVYAISHDHRGAEDIPFVNDENDFQKIVCQLDDPYCEIPFYFPTRNRIKEEHIRFKYAVEQVKFDRPTTLTVLSKQRKGLLTEFKLRVEGSGQMSVYLTAQEGSSIVNCSIAEPITDPGRNMFLFLTCSGEKCGSWDVDITVQGEESHHFLAGVSSHYLHGPNMISNTLKEITKTILENREKNYNWAITASAWNVDLVYKYI
ncbi:unnamed protein product [Auanema sp. JU1783]|nr:unnamed protein product [Auanema sp. JU1783]